VRAHARVSGGGGVLPIECYEFETQFFALKHGRV
jgi:hypothetical protein